MKASQHAYTHLPVHSLMYWVVQHARGGLYWDGVGMYVTTHPGRLDGLDFG